MNIQSMVIIAIILFTFYLFIKDYKRTRNLATISNKVNIANQDFYLDIVLMDKYKRIKVSQEVFEYYKVGHKILW